MAIRQAEPMASDFLQWTFPTACWTGALLGRMTVVWYWPSSGLEVLKRGHNSVYLRSYRLCSAKTWLGSWMAALWWLCLNIPKQHSLKPSKIQGYISHQTLDLSSQSNVPTVI